MRISDWSSDVCSSDLMLKMLRNTPRSSFDNLYLTQSAQVQQGNWATYKGYAEDGADQSLKQVAGNGVPIIEQQLQQGGALLPSALRSEEHTSELQSLMRISYAVFCLKKKKNNIKNTKIHNKITN